MDSMPYLSIIGDRGTVFFATYQEEEGTSLFYLPAGADVPQEILTERKKGGWITGMGKDPNGNLVFSYGSYGDSLEQLELVKITEEGTLLTSVDVTDLFKDMGSFEAEHLLADEEGNYYIGNGKTLYVADSKGELLYQLETEKTIEDMFFTGEGKMMLSHKGELEEVVLDKRRLKPVNSEISFPNGNYESGRQKELIYSSGNILYACHVKDKEPVEILNWMNHDINSRNVQCFTILEDGKIAVFTSREKGKRGENELILLEKTEKSAVPEKTVLTYGEAFESTSTTEKIIKFNKLNDKYQVEIKSYGDESTDAETRKRRIQTDIISGEGPDIMDIGILFSEEERSDFAEMGILENLNPYFEKDEIIQKEDYLEKVLEVYEKDDYLYAVMPFFGIKFLVGKAADIGESNSFTMDEMMTYMDSLPKEKRVLPGTDRNELLTVFLRLKGQEFVNWESGACYFNGPEFKQLLEFVSRFPNEADEDFIWFQNIEQIRNGDVPLLEYGAISVHDFQTIPFMFGEPANEIGYPTASGSGVIAFPSTSVLAIASSSRNKEGAWEFIRFLLEEDRQFESGIYGTEGFPIHKSALDMIFKEEMKAVYEKDKEGNIQEKSTDSWSAGNFEEGKPVITIPFYAATKEEIERLKELFDSIGNSMEKNLDRKILEIISEEAEAYFQGQKEIDEVADMIQSRSSLYIKEQM